MSLAAIVTAALGVAIYAGATGVSAPLVIGATFVVALALVLLAAVGAVVGAKAADLATYLMRAWTGALVLVAAGVAALVTHVGVQASVGEATGRDKAIGGAIAGLAVLFGEQFSKLIEKHGASWFSFQNVCRRYRTRFQGMPLDPGPGVEAYEACTICWLGYDGADWTVAATENRLNLISDSLDAGDYTGGPNYKPLPPAEPFPASP